MRLAFENHSMFYRFVVCNLQCAIMGECVQKRALLIVLCSVLPSYENVLSI